jgi:hypothetical protein
VADKTEVSIGFNPHLDNWVAEVAINDDFAIDIAELDGSTFVIYHGPNGEPYQRRCSLDSLYSGIETAKQKLAEVRERG